VNKQTCGSNDILSRIAKCPLCHIELSDSAVEISQQYFILMRFFHYGRNDISQIWSVTISKTK